jgi:hypothetical protein
MLERVFLIVAPISAIFGAALFVAATVYLTIERCASGCTGFLEGMNRTPALSATGQVIVGMLLVLLLAGRWGRGVTVGFLVAFLLTAASSFRATLFVWGVSASGSVSLAAVSPRASQTFDRIQELQARGLDERAGGVLIYRVLDCIAQTPPAQPGEIAGRNCEDLRASWEGYTGPERFSAGDTAWRWSYTKHQTGFQVTVYPDAMLVQTRPQFTSDQTGRTTVLRADGPPVDYSRPR